jgi:hypothetical protein
MRSPAEYFIKYLISQDKHSNAVTLRILEDLDLDFGFLTEEHIDKLDISMGDFPEPWDPGVRDKKSDAFLKKHGIRDLWYPSAGVKEAYTILGSPQLRSDVEQLLLAPIKAAEIAKRLRKHRGVTITPDGVSAFGHYFWNKKLLSSNDWMTLLEKNELAPGKASALMLSPDVAPDVVSWTSGMAGPPSSFSTGSVARRVRDVAFLKILEIEKFPATLAHSKMMRNYEDVIRYAEQEMRQSDMALKDVLKAFEKFRMRKDPGSVPSIEEIAGPNYSSSGEGTDTEDYLLKELGGGHNDADADADADN